MSIKTGRIELPIKYYPTIARGVDAICVVEKVN